MTQLVPVDHDPFAQAPSGQPRLVPVDHDPFAPAAPTPFDAAGDEARRLGISQGQRHGIMAAETAGNAVADLIGTPVDLPALAAKGALYVGDQTIGRGVNYLRGNGNVPTESSTIVPWSPASNLIKDTSRSVADYAGLPDVNPLTPGEKIATTMGELGGAMLGGGALARGIQTGAQGVGRVAEVLGSKPVQTVGRMLSGVAPYDDAAARAAQSTTALGRVANNVAPHAVDAATGAGMGYIAEKAQEKGFSPYASTAAMLGTGLLGGFTARNLIKAGTDGVPAVGRDIAKVFGAPLNPEFGGATDRAIGDAKQALDYYAALGGQTANEAAANVSTEAARQAAAGLNSTNTSGLMSNNTGLIQLEKSLRSNPEFSPGYISRDQALQGNFRNTMERSYQPQGPGSPDAARQFVEQRAADARSRDAEGIRSAENSLASAQKDLDQFQQSQSAFSMTPQGRASSVASAEVNSVARTAMNDAEKTRTALYNEARRLGADTPIDVSPIIARAREVQSALGDVVAPESPFAGVKAQLDELSNGQTDVASLLNLNADLGYTLNRANGNSPLRYQLGQLKDAVQGQLDLIRQQGGPLAEAITKADDFQRNTFGPLFQQNIDPVTGGQSTAMGRIRDAEAAGSAPQPSQFVKQAVQSPEDLDNLSAVLRRAPADQRATAEQALSRALAMQMLDTVAPNGEMSIPAIRAWQHQNADLLARNPEAARMVDETLTDLVNRTNRVSTLGQEVKVARDMAARTEDELARGASRLFLGKDPEVAAREFMASPDSSIAQQVKDLLDKDPTGAARAGFESALFQELYAKTANASAGAASDEGLRSGTVTSVNRLRPEQIRTLEAYYGKDAVNQTREAARQIEILARRSQQATTGSPTVPNMLNYDRLGAVAKLVIRQSTSNPLAGAAWATNLRLAVDALGLGGNETRRVQAATRVLDRAMKDPGVFQLLANRPSNPAQLRNWNRELATKTALLEMSRQQSDRENRGLVIDIPGGTARQ